MDFYCKSPPDSWTFLTLTSHMCYCQVPSFPCQSLNGFLKKTEVPSGFQSPDFNYLGDLDHEPTNARESD